MFFPATDRNASETGADDDGRSRLRGTETVLLVEDDPGVRAMTRAALEGLPRPRCRQRRRGCTCGAAGCSPDRSLGEYLACGLFITGDSADALEGGAMSGQAAYLQKPFTPAVLAAKMRAMLDA